MLITTPSSFPIRENSCICFCKCIESLADAYLIPIGNNEGEVMRYFLGLELSKEIQKWHGELVQSLVRELNIAPYQKAPPHVTIRAPQTFHSVEPVVRYLEEKVSEFSPVSLELAGFRCCVETGSPHEYAVVITVSGDAVHSFRQQVLPIHLWDFAERLFPHISVARRLHEDVARDAVALLTDGIQLRGTSVSAHLSLFCEESGVWIRHKTFPLATSSLTVF